MLHGVMNRIKFFSYISRCKIFKIMLVMVQALRMSSIEIVFSKTCISIRGVFKGKGELGIFLKSAYLFINIYFVPFKAIPLGYNTLVTTLVPILEALLK